MNRWTAAVLGAAAVLAICLFSCKYLMETSLSTVSNEPSEDFCIIIDAGHGGEDGGASANDGTNEKVINLAVSQRLENMLSAAGYKTVMVRSEDKLIGNNSLSTIRERKVSDIKTRLKVAEDNPNSLFISIHQNHFSVPKYSGAQVFYSPNASESMALAQGVQQSIVSFLQPDNTREIKKSGTNIYLLYHCKSPAIMVECGFLSNPAEAERLKSADYQTKMAFSIMCGIINYLE